MLSLREQFEAEQSSVKAQAQSGDLASKHRHKSFTHPAELTKIMAEHQQQMEELQATNEKLSTQLQEAQTEMSELKDTVCSSVRQPRD